MFLVPEIAYLLMGVSLSKPHIDHDNNLSTRGLMVWIYVCMYVSIYVSFTTRLSHLGSQDPCMLWNAAYIGVLTGMI